jgi:hypothetical protein
MNKKIYFKIYSFYILISAALFPYLRYGIQQDQISYMSIAGKYSKGLFAEAVNGVWSPLISWLLIPFIKTGADPLISFKILQLLIGFFVLNGILLLVKSKLSLFTVNIPVSILIIASAYLTGTPDLLMAGCLIYYLYFFIKAGKSGKARDYIITGIFAATAFYAKAYALPFFIAHFSILMIVKFFQESRSKKIIGFYLFSLVAFLLISAPWIIALTIKYERLTYSTAGEYNLAVVGPDYENVHTFRMEGLIAPFDENSVSYWEEPTHLNYKKWSPLESGESFLFFIELVLINTLRLLGLLLSYSPLFLFIIAFNPEFKRNQQIFFTIVIYSMGLTILFIEQRFLILPILLIILLTFSASERILSLTKSNYKNLFIAIIIITTLIRPVYSLISHVNHHKDLYYTGKFLSTRLFGNMASLSKEKLSNEWAASLYIAYASGAKYYGEVQESESTAVTEELRNNNIDFLIVWDEDKEFDDIFNKHYSIKLREYTEDPLEKIKYGLYELFCLDFTSPEHKKLYIYRIE